MNKHDIVKGASIVSRMQLERHKILTDLIQDVRYYSLHKGCFRPNWLRRTMFKNRYQKDTRRHFNPNIRNLALAIASISYDLATSDYSHMSCGWQDHYGEVEDYKRSILRRLVIAYRYLKWKERGIDK